jgi:carbon storage regulator
LLILSRKTNEAIQIGEDIEVKILSIEGDQVKIGINAPRNIDIHRKEIFLTIKSENDEAAKLPENLLEKLKK